MRYLVVLTLGAVIGAAVMFVVFPSLRPAPLPDWVPDSRIATVDLTATDQAAQDTHGATPPDATYPDADGVPPQEPSPAIDASAALDAVGPPGPSPIVARDDAPAREGYEPAQPGGVVPLEAAPGTAPDADATAAPIADRSIGTAGAAPGVSPHLVDTPLRLPTDPAARAAGLAPALAGAPVHEPSPTPAPLGPTPPATEPAAKEPVAPHAVAAQAIVGDNAKRLAVDPDPKPRAVPAPVYLPQAGALTIPVNGVEATQLLDTFAEGRDGRSHEAIDIVAPAGTPVVAADAGKVVKLFDSKRGGLTVYQFDPTEKFAYYYAHLQSYAPDLAEGKVLKRGDLIGYVGATGNANPLTPHLHFAVFVLGPEKRWWQGTAINPFPLLGGGKGTTAVATNDAGSR
jgi:murein DD-endopeptidase MepM/ murein hydrolase activator NlpD